MRSIPYTISWKGQLLNKARKTLNTHFWRQSATKTTHATSTGRCLIADFPTKAEASNHQRCWEQFPICWKLSRPMIIDLASTWLGFVDWIDQCHDYDLMICNLQFCILLHVCHKEETHQFSGWTVEVSAVTEEMASRVWLILVQIYWRLKDEPLSHQFVPN